MPEFKIHEDIQTFNVKGLHLATHQIKYANELCINEFIDNIHWMLELASENVRTYIPNFKWFQASTQPLDETELDYKISWYRCADFMFKWEFVISPACDCGVARQTIENVASVSSII